MSDLLSENERLIYKLRSEGLNFREIGEKIGKSPGRAQQLYAVAFWKLTREPHWMDGLSIRAKNILENADINNREEALNAMQSGRLKPGHPRNYGWVTHLEVAKWLGLQELRRESTKIRRIPTICPHCGGKIS